MLDPDRQFADAASGRVIDGIGDCSIDADNSDLADALDAERVHLP